MSIDVKRETRNKRQEMGDKEKRDRRQGMVEGARRLRNLLLCIFMYYLTMTSLKDQGINGLKCWLIYLTEVTVLG